MNVTLAGVPASTLWTIVGWTRKEADLHIGDERFPGRAREVLSPLFRLRPVDLDLPAAAAADDVIREALSRGLEYCPEEVFQKLAGARQQSKRFGTIFVVPMSQGVRRLLWVRSDGVIAPTSRIVLASVRDWMVVMAQSWSPLAKP